MRRAAAAGLLAWALAAYAQVPPETPPPNEAQPPAAPSQDQSPAPQPAAGEAAPAETASGRAKAAQPPPAARVSAPKASQPKAPAPVREESAGDAQLAALRREVNRLQSELDAERAAAAASTAVEDGARGSRSARGVWGWFVATALLALGAGFLLGWRLLDRRIRRQYGGLRIY